jgi:HSP20 family protein
MTKNNEVAVVQQKNTQLAVRPELQENFVTPFADVCEMDDAYVVALDMPGTTRESINISLEVDALVVKGKVQPYHREDATMLLNELGSPRTYYRVFNLGSGINRNAIEAQYEHGVLLMKLHKNEELKPRVIPIK